MQLLQPALRSHSSRVEASELSSAGSSEDWTKISLELAAMPTAITNRRKDLGRSA